MSLPFAAQRSVNIKRPAAKRIGVYYEKHAWNGTLKMWFKVSDLPKLYEASEEETSIRHNTTYSLLVKPRGELSSFVSTTHLNTQNPAHELVHVFDVELEEGVQLKKLTVMSRSPRAQYRMLYTVTVLLGLGDSTLPARTIYFTGEGPPDRPHFIHHLSSELAASSVIGVHQKDYEKAILSPEHPGGQLIPPGAKGNTDHVLEIILDHAFDSFEIYVPTQRIDLTYNALIFLRFSWQNSILGEQLYAWDVTPALVFQRVNIDPSAALEQYRARLLTTYMGTSHRKLELIAYPGRQRRVKGERDYLISVRPYVTAGSPDPSEGEERSLDIVAVGHTYLAALYPTDNLEYIDRAENMDQGLLAAS